MATPILRATEGAERRYFMELSYCGAPFSGWQRQPSDPSVQQLLEERLTMLLGRPVGVTGAGRTDAGVNARCMTAHFDVPQLADPAELVRRLNAVTGPWVAIHRLRPVREGAHARFDAVARTYRYFVTHRKSPFFGHLAWHCPRPLDYGAMNKAAAWLLEADDFTSFAKLHSDARTNICRVTRAVWEPGDVEGTWQFTITADRFLRNMVRAVVGTLVDVGRGKMEPGQMAAIIGRRSRAAAGTSMPAHGLYLWDVAYAPDIYV